ncbi:hypothetical protein GCM10025854_09000 [Tetragenococcus muriaticus]|nr:HAD-IA family hydrolase [Tetragenococcus muriaticus]GMA46650.1 hypothetical protein GCM10025854_09000 [Tetragenococcus muriaticus]
MTDKEIVKSFGPSEERMIEKNLINRADTSEAIEMFYKLYLEQHDSFISQKEIKQVLVLLDHLKRNQKKVGMVTGKGRRVLEMSLDKLGLGNYFDAMITDDDVINHKPDSERLLKALKILNSNPEEAVFFGDGNTDIGAGKNIGVTTVGVRWFSENRFELEPDYISDSPSEFVISN